MAVVDVVYGSPAQVFSGATDTADSGPKAFVRVPALVGLQVFVNGPGVAPALTVVLEGTADPDRTSWHALATWSLGIQQSGAVVVSQNVFRFVRARITNIVDVGSVDAYLVWPD